MACIRDQFLLQKYQKKRFEYDYNIHNGQGFLLTP